MLQIPTVVPSSGLNGFCRVAALLLMVFSAALGRCAMAETHAMLIVGLSGEKAVAQRQANELTAWQELFLAQGVSRERTITILTDNAIAEAKPALAVEVEQAQPPTTRPSTTRDAILTQLREWKSSLGAQDDVVIVLIGLGTIRDSVHQFQIKGPRLSGEDLKTGLAGNVRSYTIIATGPGGSALADLLAGPNRVIISATASATEINQTQFGQLWAEAAREIPQANILEILQLTDQKIGTFYKDAQLARTETAVLRIGNAAPIHSPFEVPLPKALLQYWTFTALHMPVAPPSAQGRNIGSQPATNTVPANARP